MSDVCLVIWYLRFPNMVLIIQWHSQLWGQVLVYPRGSYIIEYLSSFTYRPRTQDVTDVLSLRYRSWVSHSRWPAMGDQFAILFVMVITISVSNSVWEEMFTEEPLLDPGRLGMWSQWCRPGRNKVSKLLPLRCSVWRFHQSQMLRDTRGSSMPINFLSIFAFLSALFLCPCSHILINSADIY
jgi:hypothetical protein